MRRGTSRLVEREQKAESHVVTMHKGKARVPKHPKDLDHEEPKNRDIRNEQSKLLLDWGGRFTEAQTNGGRGPASGDVAAVEPASRRREGRQGARASLQRTASCVADSET